MVTGALAHELVAIAQQVLSVGHGSKEAIYQQACTRLGLSRATLLRKLAKVTIREARKQRDDAGKYTLTRDEAVLISAVLMESHRKNRKRLMSIGRAVDILRANHEIRAERIDPVTGECIPLTESAIARALRGYCLHPDQLLRPKPMKELQSLYPNHVWQIDASLCVLYYLNTQNQRESGLQVMAHDEFYKNKPKNLKRIESNRVWSYEVTDHYSGSIFVHYVLGAESAANISESFIEAIQQRDNKPFHGVPEILMMDKGSANTSGVFKNLLRRLGIKAIPHAAKKANVTGQVEKARDIIERDFESSLKLRPVGSFAELNQAARMWAVWFNSTQKHSRHKCTRYSKWLDIRQDQLRIAPPRELCVELLTHEPKKAKVTQDLTVNFNGHEYDVASIPRVQVGEWFKVTYNPFKPDCASIVDTDESGHELLQDVPVVNRNDAGFRLDANVIGEDYARHKDTIADTNRKLVERVITGTDSDAQAEEKRKAITKGRAVAFDGRIDPYKHMRETQLPTYIPRAGTEMELTTRVATTEPRLLNHFEAAKELVSMGAEMNAQRNALVRSLYPQGVPEDQLESLKARLATAGQMRVVAGGKD